MTKGGLPISHPDGDEHKGVVEDDSPHLRGERSTSQESMTGQLGHRNADDLTSGNDSDYPEPGLTPEHSGQHN
jgi:hypothetical protein